MKKIAGTRWSHGSAEVLEHNNESEIRELLLGRRVVEVEDDHMRLDDGTLLKVIPNEGGCACSAGDYSLDSLNRVENVITSVEFDYHPGGDYETIPDPLPGDSEWDGHYRIFVLAGDERINLLNITGSDGNGYYGTGYSILVRKS